MDLNKLGKHKMTAVYNTPFGCSALKELANHLHKLHMREPHRLAETVVLLPTRRACLGLESEFEQFAPTFIPKIIALPDLEADPSLMGFIPEAVNVLNKPKMITLLTKILAPLLPQLRLFERYKLAEALASIIDEVETSGIALENLANIELDSVSEYWHVTKTILA